MSSRNARRPVKQPVSEKQTPSPPTIPEWLDYVRITVENEAPLVQTLMRRAINAVLRFAELSEASVVRAAAAPNDLIVLVTALSSGELLDELKSFEPLAPAFIRGIEAQRRLLEEYGGILTAQQAGEILGISRQSVDKRRRAHTLLPLTTGRHGYRYPAWQFTKFGAVLSGVEDVLQALGPHDEWMQAAFFASENPRLANRITVKVLK